MIPRILHRCVPAEVPDRYEEFWRGWLDLHPSWVGLTWQDPIHPALFPLSSPAWPHVRAGAALAGLVRLEALASHGGIFLDWDVRPVRPLDDLLEVRGGMFAAWEDDEHVPDAVFGCVAGHPAVVELRDLAIAGTIAGDSVWEVSVGLFTASLPRREDVTLLPSASFYPVHYSEERAHPGASAAHVPGPDTYGVHEWAWSWGPGS